MGRRFFIIDGYNLIHAAGLIARSVGSETLRRSRKQLLHILQRSLTGQERVDTTVVFDVHRFKSEIPPREFYAEISIINAVEYPDADTCIEELIQKHSAPRQLVVVSSDHRLQHAARVRKATFVDSEDFLEYLNSRSTGSSKSDPEQEKSQPEFHYPEEDLPDNVQDVLHPSADTEDLSLWKKRINELLEEED